MKSLKQKYRFYFSDKTFTTSVIIAILLLLFSFVINYYAGIYATEKASSPVNDIILNNFSTRNVEEIFIYGPVVLWVFVAVLCFHEPKKIPFVFKSVAIFILIRSVFITLTHIGPFPDRIALDVSPTGWFQRFAFGGDLFFSAHTGLPYLMALVFWDHKVLRVIFVLAAVFFGIIVLLGHLHYSIDVLSAFFITYTIYHIAEVVFKKDKKYFEEVAPLIHS